MGIVTRILFILFLFIGLSSAPVLAQPSNEIETSQSSSEYDAFLRRMGFEDFSAELRKSLREENFLNKHISRRVLEYQSERYEIYNHVRSLAVEILETLHTRNRSPESREKIVEFATRLLATKPYQLDNRLPRRYENDPYGAASHLTEVTRENIDTQSEIIMADLIHTLYGKESIDEVLKSVEKDSSNVLKNAEVAHLLQLQKKVNHLVQFMYLDNEMGGFSVSALGKALVLGLTRYQILKDRTNPNGKKEDNLVTKMKKSLRKSGLYYENYVGRRLIIEGQEGTYSVEIRNGDHIFERSFGKQANEITAGVRPSGIKNWLFALRLNLLGSVIGRNFHTEDDTVKENPGFKDRIFKKIRESKLLTNGVSHAGIAEVLADPETEMETTRSLDSYLDEKEGGIRITDILHQFARKSEFLRLIVSRFDAKKLAAYGQRQAQEVGYQEVVWMGEKENKDGTISKKKGVPWTTSITKDDYDQLHALAGKNPQTYAQEISRRVVHEIKDLFYKGPGFAAGFNNAFGRAYCSFIMYLAYRKGTGLNPVPSPDRWNFIVQIAKRMNFPGTDKLDLTKQLISPGAFIWQRELIDPNDIQVVDYPLLSTEKRIIESFSPREVAMDPELYRRLIALKSFVNGARHGSEEAAEKTLLTTAIQDAITIHRQYHKNADTNDHGRPHTSYLAKVDELIRSIERRSQENNQKSRPSIELNCPAVFKKK